MVETSRQTNKDKTIDEVDDDTIVEVDGYVHDG
jgi:hypothetical protein